MIGGLIGVLGGLALVVGLPAWLGAAERPIWWLLVLHLFLSLLINFGIRGVVTYNLLHSSKKPVVDAIFLVGSSALIGTVLSFIPYGIGRWLF